VSIASQNRLLLASVHSFFNYFCSLLITAIRRSTPRLRFAGATTAIGMIAFLLAVETSAFSAEHLDAFHYNRLLGRGINLGNALDAPREGAWGVTLKSKYFQDISDAGFNSVRIPIRWSSHAGTQPPYAIQPMFFSRVDWAIKQALSRGLVAIIDVHHYDEMHKDPVEHLPRLVGMWRQIAQHYRDYPDRLYFELLNEPFDQLTDDQWRGIFPKLLQAVRETNPTRTVIVGPAYWNDLRHLAELHLPEEDRHLIATFHYYSPFQFTHQGASFVPGSDAWKGKTWTDSAQEREALARDFDIAAAWAAQNRRPLYVGEFGSYQEADIASRVRWTGAVVSEARKRGFSWAYWEFCSTFGAYDPVALTWRQPLLRSLINTGNGKD
jgi:endoglucanase